VAGCAYLAEKQGEFIFRPSSSTWGGASNLAANYEEHWIPVGEGGAKLHAYYAAAENPAAPVLLYLHGARWNLSGSVTRIDRWRKLGFHVLAIDYRGFGQSTPASPSETLANEDAEAAWAYLDRLAPGKKRFVAGHSLGGAIAVDLVRRHPEASGVVLEATFTSIRDMAQDTWFAFLPLDLLLTERFDSLAKVSEIRVPVLVTHGTEDRVVPYAMGEKLYDAIRAPKKFLRVEGASHHNLSYVGFEAYRQAIHELFAL